MVSYIGSFGKGFVDAFVRARQMKAYEAYQAEMINYYQWLMGRPPIYHFAGEGEYGDPAIGAGVRSGEGAGQVGHGHALGRGEAVGGDFTTEEMLSAAKKAGFEGDDIAHIVAIAQAESSGRLGAVNPKTGSAGLTQINPHAWGQEMADKAKGSLQGSFDAAYTVYKKQGWGAWAVDPSSKFFDPRDDMSRFLPTTRIALHNIERGGGTFPDTEVAKGKAPETTSATGTGSGKVTTGAPAAAAPAGGTFIKVKGDWYQTNEKGEIVGDKLDPDKVPDAAKKQVTSQADQHTPYQVAGPMEAITEQQAQRAREDLQRHMVSPATQAEAGGREPPVTQGPMAAARRGETPPPPTDRTPISAIPKGPRVAAQDDQFQPPFESGFPYVADPRMPPRTLTPEGAYPPPYRPEDDPRNRTTSTYDPTTSPTHPAYDPLSSVQARPSGIPYGPSDQPITRTPIGGGAGNVLGSPHYDPLSSIRTPTTQPERGPELAGSLIHQEHPGPEAYGGPLTARSEGKGKGKAADKPAKKATATALEKKAPPKQAIPTPEQAPYALGGQHQAIGSARSPLNRDPFWRPNFPLDTKRGQAQAVQNPPKYATPPTGVSQIAHNIARAVGISQPEHTAAAPVAVSGGGTRPTAEEVAAHPPPKAPPPPDTGGEGGGGPSVQTPDTAPSPTNLPIEMPFSGQDVTGRSQQQQAQLIQAQPVPVARRQEAAPEEDGGDVSPTVLGAAKGGPIGIPERPVLKFQGGGGAAYGNNTAAWQPTTSPTPYQTFQPAAGQPLPTVQPPSMGSTQMGMPGSALAASQPGYQPFDMWGWLGQQSGSTILSGQQAHDALQNLTPAQQQWYNEQSANEMAAGGRGHWFYNPASYSALTPPAAAAPVAGPASPPNVITKTSYLPAASANTAVNVPGGATNTTQPANPALTWAPGQSGTITAPNTSPTVATFGDTSYGSPVATNIPGATNTQSSTGTGTVYNVDDKDKITGVRRGGPIYKFQLGGMSPNPAIAAMNSPNYVGPTLQGGWQGTPYSQLAPNQQAWADQTRNILNQELSAAHADAAYWGAGGTNPTGVQDTMQYWNQLTTMPGGAVTTVPATPTVTNKTNQITTTTPAKTAVNVPSGASDTTQPADPNLKWAAGSTPNAPNTSPSVATFGDTSYGSPVAQNIPGTTNTQSTSGSMYNIDTTGNITGARRGGPIRRYDDGGGVSPATLGMPPGLQQGGQQPVPPIYYNPANFSADGAGVGRGFSHPNVSTYGAQGIPTYAGGGIVKYDDGGGVGYDTDLTASSEDQPEISDASFGGGMIYTPHQPQFPAFRTPHMMSGGMGMGGGGGMGAPRMMRPPSGRAYAGTYASDRRIVNDDGSFNYDENGYRIKPEGLPNSAPQINDGYGNLSYGATSALTSVLHFLGNALGLGGPQTGIAPDHPMVQTNRRDMANGVPIAGVQESAERAIQQTDPTNTLNRELKVIGTMEGMYRYHLENGDPEGAVRAATTFYMYLNYVVGQYGKAAIQDYKNGDMPTMLQHLSDGSENIPNGQHFEGHWDFDANQAIITQTDLNGKVLWHGPVSPQALLMIATHAANGQAAYNALEQVVTQHDPEARAMAAAKRKEADADARSAAMEKAYGSTFPSGAGGGPGDTMPGGAAPKLPITPAATTGAPVASAQAPAPVTASSQAPPPAAAPASPVPPQQPPPPGSAGPGGTTGAPTTGTDASAPGPGDTLTPRAEPAVAQRGTGMRTTPLPSQAPSAFGFDRTAIEKQIDDEFAGNGWGGYKPDASMPNRIDTSGVSNPTDKAKLENYNRQQIQKWIDGKKAEKEERLKIAMQSASDVKSQALKTQGEEFSVIQGNVGRAFSEKQANRRVAAEQAGKLLQDQLNRDHEDRVRKEIATVAAEKPLQWTDTYKEDQTTGIKASVREAANKVVPDIVVDTPAYADADPSKVYVPKADQHTVGQAIGDIYRFSQGRIDMPDAGRMVQMMINAPFYASPFTATYDPKDRRVHVSVSDGRDISTFVVSDDTYRPMNNLIHSLREESMARQVKALHTQAQGIRTREAGAALTKQRLEQTDRPKVGIPTDEGMSIGPGM